LLHKLIILLNKSHFSLLFAYLALRTRPVDSHSRARKNIIAGPLNIFTGPF